MLFEKFRQVLVHNILGLDDTPHRIAFGVLLGFVVAFTPTIGFQIILYVTIATLLRANKLSGIPILFLTNPVTAVPVYWFCWKVGGLALGTPTGEGDAPNADALDALFAGKDTVEGAKVLLTAEFWERAVATAVELGAELWVGSFIVGFALGIPFYFITIAAVRAFRRAKAKIREQIQRRSSVPPPAAP